MWAEQEGMIEREHITDRRVWRSSLTMERKRVHIESGQQAQRKKQGVQEHHKNVRLKTRQRCAERGDELLKVSVEWKRRSVR